MRLARNGVVLARGATVPCVRFYAAGDVAQVRPIRFFTRWAFCVFSGCGCGLPD
jgi:hypothetical protein